MESLDGTEWDVVIIGTGLKQSLLALALSRTGKKILHLDENNYYGGSEAALTLRDAEEWAQKANSDSNPTSFSRVDIRRSSPERSDAIHFKLGPPRAYSLALCPQIVYARSELLPVLVSSKVYRQLEFLPVGTWWVYSSAAQHGTQPSASEERSKFGRLLRVPNGREDIFQDHDLDFKAKRALMKFLRFISEYEEQTDIWHAWRNQSFTSMLSNHFRLPDPLQAPILALASTSTNANAITVEYALPRIARHLRSIGVFGAGFAAVLPKWGGLSEICQVACRASAVGGGVYALGQPISHIEGCSEAPEKLGYGFKVELASTECVTTRWLVQEDHDVVTAEGLSRSISVVASPLSSLFPTLSEDGPPPASAVVVFPSGSLSRSLPTSDSRHPDVHIHVHSSDTGECPIGQSVLYAATSLQGDRGFDLLQVAHDVLLSCLDEISPPTTLYSLRYTQQAHTQQRPVVIAGSGSVARLSPNSLDHAFDDSALADVRKAWEKIMGDDAKDFMMFDDRHEHDDVND